MINKEEKKAIDLLKVLKLSFKNSEPYKVTYTLANGNEYTGTEIDNIFETILNLIKKHQQEITNLQEINKEHQKLNGELQQKITELENTLNGIAIQELGTSDLYKED